MTHSKRSQRLSVAAASLCLLAASACVTAVSGEPLKPGDSFLPGSENNWTPGPICASNRTVAVRNQSELSAAVANAQAGDTIWLEDGNYGAASLNLNRSGSQAAPICIVAANKHQAIFSGLRVTYSGNYFNLMNLKVQGGNVDFDMRGGSNFRASGNHFDSVSPGSKYMIDVDWGGQSNVNFRWDSNLITNFTGRVMRASAADAYDGVPAQVGRQPRPELTPRNIYFDHNYVQWRKGQPEIPGGVDDSHAFKIGGDVGNDADQNLHISFNTFRDYPGSSNLFLHWKSSGNYFAYNKLTDIGAKAGIGARSGGNNKIIGNVVHGAGAWFELDDANNLVEGNYVINYERTNYGVGSVLLHGNIAGKDNFGIDRNGSNRYRNSFYYQRTTGSLVRNNVFISKGEPAIGAIQEGEEPSMSPGQNWFLGNLFHNLDATEVPAVALGGSTGNAFTDNHWSNFSGLPAWSQSFNGDGLSLNPDVATVTFSFDTNPFVQNISGPGTRP